MSLKVKWFLAWLAASVAPAVLLVEPWIGLAAKSHRGRLVQVWGGSITIAALALFEYFIGYRGERRRIEAIERSWQAEERRRILAMTEKRPMPPAQGGRRGFQ